MKNVQNFLGILLKTILKFRNNRFYKNFYSKKIAKFKKKIYKKKYIYIYIYIYKETGIERYRLCRKGVTPVKPTGSCFGVVAPSTQHIP